MTETRDAGLTPERVEALVLRARKIAGDDGCYGEGPNYCYDSLPIHEWCPSCVMQEAAATIAELRAGMRAEAEKAVMYEDHATTLRAELGTAIRERDEARAGHALAGQRAMEAADELERKGAALRLAHYWLKQGPEYRKQALDVLSNALAPVADQTGETSDE